MRVLVCVFVVAMTLGAVAASSSSSSSSESSSESSSSGSSTAAVGADGYRTECVGRGARYCRSPWVYECPPDCVRQCEGDYSSGDSDSEGEWDSMRLALRLALRKRVFDQAFVHEGALCVANCGDDPSDLGCREWADYMGDRFCVAVACGGKVGACGRASDFSKATCKACRMAFPRCRLL